MAERLSNWTKELKKPFSYLYELTAIPNYNFRYIHIDKIWHRPRMLEWTIFHLDGIQVQAWAQLFVLYYKAKP